MYLWIRKISINFGINKDLKTEKLHQHRNNMALRYLTEMCTPTATSARRQPTHYSDLVIPRVRLATYCSCAFSVAGPVYWNGLVDYLTGSVI